MKEKLLRLCKSLMFTSRVSCINEPYIHHFHRRAAYLIHRITKVTRVTTRVDRLLYHIGS